MHGEINKYIHKANHFNTGPTTSSRHSNKYIHKANHFNTGPTTSSRHSKNNKAKVITDFPSSLLLLYDSKAINNNMNSGSSTIAYITIAYMFCIHSCVHHSCVHLLQTFIVFCRFGSAIKRTKYVT